MTTVFAILWSLVFGAADLGATTQNASGNNQGVINISGDTPKDAYIVGDTFKDPEA